jgi:tetratricopeptide (TPR) repeat protein
VQSALTLIVGKGALTQSGREGWERFLKSRGIAEHHWQEWSCAAAGGALLVVGGLHASLPTIAIAYTNRGETHYLANRLASALGNYQVALNLRPDYPEAHYNLGLVYEDLQKEDEAIASYRFVVEQDPESVDPLTWLKANNNLARLYILQDDTRNAVPLLIQSLQAITPEQVEAEVDFAKIQYSLLKNWGWARFEQERYAEAEAQLDEAIQLLQNTIPPDGNLRNRGSSYCLMAQVLDAQDRAEDADRLWETCLAEANLGNPDEDTWIGVYEQRASAASPDVNEENPE